MQNTNSIFAYLPQKKFTYVLFGVLVAVGGGFYFLEKQEEKKADEERVAGESARIAAAEQFQIDTDNDGLKDWEEVLLGSDKDNPDTDTDGTEDGQEVKEGRNPLMKGPSDKYSDEQEDEFAAKRKEGMSELDGIFLEMFAAATTLRKNDQLYANGTSSDLYAIAEKEVEAYGQRLIRLDSYNTSDIRTSNDSSPAALRKYGNAVGAAMMKHDVPSGTEPDLLIIFKSLKNNDPDEMRNLDYYINFYNESLVEILGLPVPKDLAIAHIHLLNSMKGYVEILRAMRRVFTDPFAAATGLKRYEEVLASLRDARDEISAVFKKHDVVFANAEPGVIFGPTPDWLQERIAGIYIQSGIPITTPPQGVQFNQQAQ